MTTDELKKEADEYFKNICEDYNEEYERTGKRHYFVGFDIKNAYIDSAKPREKRIAELEKELAISEHDREHNDYELTEVYKKVAELEAQIEKMKCCYNCANDTLEPPEVIGNGICEHCKNHDKWELEY